jgi:hypothetical protein
MPEAYDLSEISDTGPHDFRRYDSTRQFKVVRDFDGRVRCFSKTSGSIESNEGWKMVPSGDLPPAEESPLRDIFAKLKGTTREALML